MHRVLYGQDAKASALGWLAMALWVLGHPDEAVSRANEGLAFVRDATQPFLVARGLAGVGFVHVFRREPAGPDTELPAALALCAEQGFTYFHAVVSAFQGANLVLLGSTREGIDLMQASLPALRTMGSELLLTPILANLASAHLALDHADEALAAIDEGLACVERNGERWAESELLRLRGQLFLTRGANHAQAEACLRKALDVARGQQAKSYELRAATALASHWRQQGKNGEAQGGRCRRRSRRGRPISTARTCAMRESSSRGLADPRTRRYLRFPSPDRLGTCGNQLGHAGRLFQMSVESGGCDAELGLRIIPSAMSDETEARSV